MRSVFARYARAFVLCCSLVFLASSLHPTIAYAEGIELQVEPASKTSPLAEHGLGLIPVESRHAQAPEDTPTLTAESERSFPSRYDSRQQPWASVISVKDQGDLDLCWAFTSTTLAEYSYAKESYEQTGTSQTLSPGHLAYFLFHRINDPLGNTAGDANYNEGGWLAGSNPIYAIMHLSTYSGACTEEKPPST